MITVIFTLDYEIYGNGTGSLKELVVDPTERLAEIFQRHRAPMVVFPEALEFAAIERADSDPDGPTVRSQLRRLRTAGHEIGLHLHPWWANARSEYGRWTLDWSERNICVLPEERVDAIVSQGIAYLRSALDEPRFSPLSYRSGLWVMQPAQPLAGVLKRHGVLADSSVYRGGRVRDLALDYRHVPRTAGAWRFSNDVTVPDSDGPLWEVPIHAEIVPFWRMLGRKRLGLQRKVPDAPGGTPVPRRWCDFLRLRYPQKLDFCRMTFTEMRDMTLRALRHPHTPAGVPAPVVAIGHSKDLVDFGAIDQFLRFLAQEGVSVTTFSALIHKERVAAS